MTAVVDYEEKLTRHLIAGLQAIEGVTIHGKATVVEYQRWRLLFAEKSGGGSEGLSRPPHQRVAWP